MPNGQPTLGWSGTVFFPVFGETRIYAWERDLRANWVALEGSGELREKALTTGRQT